MTELNAPTENSYILIAAGSVTGNATRPIPPEGDVFKQDGTTLALELADTPFDAWAVGKGLTCDDALPSANPDGDGLNNLGEWYIGSDPKTADSSGFILSGVRVTDAVDGSFEYTHDRPVDVGYITGTYQWTTDLSSMWNDSGVFTNGIVVTITPIADDPDLTPDPDYESVTVDITGSGAVSTQIFSRMLISKP